jgi:hypothetical protein
MGEMVKILKLRRRVLYSLDLATAWQKYTRGGYRQTVCRTLGFRVEGKK